MPLLCCSSHNAAITAYSKMCLSCVSHRRIYTPTKLQRNASRRKKAEFSHSATKTGRVKKAISFLFANDMHGALSQVVNKLKSKTTLRRSVSNAPEGTEFLPLLTRQQYQAYFSVCNSGWQSGSAASVGHETSAGQRKGRGFPSNIYLQPAIIG